MSKPARFCIWGTLGGGVLALAGCTFPLQHPLGNGTSWLNDTRPVPPTLVLVSETDKNTSPNKTESSTPKQAATRSSGEVRPVSHVQKQVEKKSSNTLNSLPPPKRVDDDELPLPQSTSTKGVTLDQVINTTLLADPKLRAGFEAINQANGDALTASLKPNPNLEVSQTLLPLLRPFTEDRQGGPPQLDIIVAYPIDWFLFGKRAAAMQATNLNVRVSEAEFADLVRLRVLEAAVAYYDVLEAKGLLDLAKQDAANFKRVEEITLRAVEGGGRPKVELNRIRLDRLRAEQSVRDAENALVAAKASLRAIMGQANPDSDFDVAGSLDDLDPKSDIPDVETALAIAVLNRPDIAALKWKVDQALAEQEVERRNAYPEVTPQIGYTRQFQRKAIGFPDAHSYGVGLEMSLPLFNRNQGNRLKAAATTVQQQFELQSGLVDLRAEVVQVEKELRTAAANAKAVADEQLRLASEVRDSLNKAYSEGGRPLIDVLDAQRNYRETYRIFIESRANFGRASAKFNATLGKRVTP